MQIHRSFNRAASGVVRLVRRARCARSTGRPAGSARQSVGPSGVSVVGDLSRRFQAQGAIRGDGGRFDGRSVGERRANGRARERKRRVFSRVRCSERAREREEASRQECVVVSAQTPADEQQTGRKASSLRGRERTNANILPVSATGGVARANE